MSDVNFKGIRRRSLLEGATVGATALALGALGASGVEEERWNVVDSNVSLGRWPFRRLPSDTTDGLLAQMESLGIASAWAGSYEGLLHRDIRGVNERLAQECRRSERLVPFGSINPTLPDWEDDVRHCSEELKMRGVRLHPNYHGYSLDDANFEKLLRLCAERSLLVQLAAVMEDTRTQHPLVRVKDVDLSPLQSVMDKVATVRVQILNLRPRATLGGLEKNSRIYFDSARVDATDGVARLLKLVPVRRVLFGSHAPFLIQQAAVIRGFESRLPAGQTRKVFGENAERLMNR